MNTFDVAFEKAISRTRPAGLHSPGRAGERRSDLLEETFRVVERFDFDPARLVVASSLVGEQYRSLKTSILRFRESEGVGSFVFSSSVKGEGKTTVVLNAARTLARDATSRSPWSIATSSGPASPISAVSRPASVSRK